MESAGEALFLPKLTASIASSRRAARSGLPDKNVGILARRRDRTEACPCEGKPYLLMTAESSDRRKKRGRRLPGYRVNQTLDELCVETPWNAEDTLGGSE